MIRRLLLAFMMVVPLLAVAQLGNQGQLNENCVSKITYIGYNSGSYDVVVENKQNCPTQMEVTWLDRDSIVIVMGNSSRNLSLPGAATGNTPLRLRPLDQCADNTTCWNSGWVEARSPGTLPVKFKNIKITKRQKQ